MKFASDGASSRYEFSVASSRGLTIGTGGGTLHGTWTADNAVTSSDRRLKKSIVPLYRAISGLSNRRSMQEAGADSDSMQAGIPSMRSVKDEKATAISWVLRELRPVSFSFKDGPEAKYSRYGFIAQELQQVLPNVVRGQGEEHLRVAYQDLIALLTLAAQVLQDRVNQLDAALKQHEAKTGALLNYIKELDEKVELVLATRRPFVRGGGRHTQTLHRDIELSGNGTKRDLDDITVILATGGTSAGFGDEGEHMGAGNVHV
eukprot:CAMPEP_0170211540 /NCGR_PEP_ID=MMETSP0116_2-20130129/5386_1 /TAXON_ID=400756 /ORGANISM="Durinskia baltica, Strain CSIRO CS-38" /LENGTH=260 /DNA_ID=CAMNT_0010462075 /DNA_START=1583 /DNA_END=2365 /DNA_ORIENTATION=-